MQKRFQKPSDWQWGQMVNADGAVLRTGSLSPHAKPAAHIILGPGLAEFSEKYFELANIMDRLGYNFHTLDWRGQGGSSRYLKDTFRRHSLGFDKDARDLSDFVNHHIPNNAPKFYIGHSMGALIGTLAVKADPKLFRAAILSAPLFGIGDHRVAKFEPLVAKMPIAQNLLERYIPGGGPWRLRITAGNMLKPDRFTSDPARMALNDEWTTINPSLRVGSPTIGFVQEACRSITALQKAGAVESIKTPTLIISAGDDPIVRVSETFSIAARIPGAFHTHIPLARHEILLEKDAIRRPVMKNIHHFITANLP